MKSTLFFSSLLAASLAFTSCKKEEETEAAATDTPKEIIIPDVQATTSKNYGEQPSQAVAVNPNQMTNAVPVNVNPTQAATTKSGMNPPHGQPGHRCDIAVGAPLNSAPTKPAKAVAPGVATVQTISTTTTPSSTTPAFTTTDAPVVTAPGMNPPHGQPGHVCGTPVGSPLPKADAAGTQEAK